MTTHIALEEGKDIEEVAQWSARRKLFHAQMLGAYHEHRNEQMERGREGYGEAADGVDPNAHAEMSPEQLAQQANQQAAASSEMNTNTSGGAAGAQTRGPSPADRHEVSWDVANEDVDWQFCEQCHGLFEPGEYDSHFESGNFMCAN